MKFILSTGSLYTYSTERCFRFAAAAGFDGIELMVDYRWETRQADFLQTLVDGLELPVLAVHSPFRPVPGWSKHHVSDLLEQSIELAEALAAPVVIHHLPTIIDAGVLDYWGGRAIIPTGTRLQNAYRDWLCTHYAQRQRETAVTLCIENLPAASIGGKAFNYGVWNTLESITRFPHICMDTTHLGTFGFEPAQVYRRWRHHVRHIHLSNFDGQQHRRPETGKLRLDELLAQLADDGYAHAVSLELNPDALDAGAPDAHIIERLRVSLEHCRAWATPLPVNEYEAASARVASAGTVGP